MRLFGLALLVPKLRSKITILEHVDNSLPNKDGLRETL
jgi:hypothetical protein